MNPEYIRKTNLVKVGMQLRELFLEEYSEDFYILDEECEFGFIKALKTDHLRLNQRLLGKHGSEEKESFLLTRSTHHKTEPSHKVHPLAVPNFIVIDGIRP